MDGIVFFVSCPVLLSILKNIKLFENELKMWRDLDGHYQDVESYLELLNEDEDVKADADIALIGSKPIDIDKMSNLKGIFRAGIGRDNVPIKEAQEKGC